MQKTVLAILLPVLVQSLDPYFDYQTIDPWNPNDVMVYTPTVTKIDTFETYCPGKPPAGIKCYSTDIYWEVGGMDGLTMTNFRSDKFDLQKFLQEWMTGLVQIHVNGNHVRVVNPPEHTDYFDYRVCDLSLGRWKCHAQIDYYTFEYLMGQYFLSQLMNP